MGSTLGVRVGESKLETMRGSGIINITQLQVNAGAESFRFSHGPLRKNYQHA
ncbi:hypothetical protein [Paenibacillus sp. FSL R5-0470]|uniref:hypothetical protein n=1 Tax=Paenibacillus sp. FSL R5-0470 TaxID=2921641 RepID=UPI0030DB7A7D